MQICVVIWILLIVYKTGLVEDPEEADTSFNGALNVAGSSSDRSGELSGGWDTSKDSATNSSVLNTADDWLRSLGNGAVLNENIEPCRKLSSNHWRTLLSYYNISFMGRCVNIPSIDSIF